MPIYFAKPRMSAERRFFDDEKIRDLCVGIVEREGGKDFFGRRRWRKILREAVTRYRKNEPVDERYETVEERNKAIVKDLSTSRELIESKLPGRKVTHLCYPWYEAKEFSVSASKKTGYKANYFGSVSGRPTNRLGDDPFRVTRLEDIFLQRLPGSGRKTIFDIFIMLNELRNVPHLLGLASDN
jgi:hypothetical protein